MLGELACIAIRSCLGRVGLRDDSDECGIARLHAALVNSNPWGGEGGLPLKVLTEWCTPLARELMAQTEPVVLPEAIHCSLAVLKGCVCPTLLCGGVQMMP
eukprot:102227-Amphidinium_carterae.1